MHYIEPNGKCFTKTDLIHTNNAAISEGRNQQLDEDFLETLPDDGLFVISLAFDEHNRGEIRVKILFDTEGTSGFLDLSKNRYDLLPSLVKKEDGSLILAIPDKRPYPDGRAYEEKVVRKVVRNKDFRNNVLSAYNNQCALCDINEESLLVAAHIYPAHLCDDDSVNNGICLCGNHDKAYEIGLICIKEDGEVITNSNIQSNKRIRFPEDAKNYPSIERLSQRLKLSNKKNERKSTKKRLEK